MKNKSVFLLFTSKKMNVADWQKRYNDYSSFFKILFRERVQKLSVDGGFTCPNRDGRKGTGGCTFCNNHSFNPDYCISSTDNRTHVEEGRRFFARKYQGQKYLD